MARPRKTNFELDAFVSAFNKRMERFKSVNRSAWLVFDFASNSDADARTRLILQFNAEMKKRKNKPAKSVPKWKAAAMWCVEKGLPF
jgi:hypothetical protein